MDHSSRTESDYREERDIAERRLQNYREPLNIYVSSRTGKTVDLTISTKVTEGTFLLQLDEALILQRKLKREIDALRKYQKSTAKKVSSITKRRVK